MRIAICVKPVPDLGAAYVSKSRAELVEPGGRVPNPADENAMELAAGLRDGGEVVVFCTAPAGAAEVVKPLLAMGADRACIVEDPLVEGADALATVRVLAALIRQAGDFDLVLCGAASVVHGAGQVGPRLAAALALPLAARVTSAKPLSGGLATERAALGSIELPLPCLLTVEPGCNTPRLPNAMAVMKAARKPVESVSLDALGLAAEEVGAAGAGARLRVSELPG